MSNKNKNNEDDELINVETQGFLKVVRYFEDLCIKADFENFVAEMRSKYFSDEVFIEDDFCTSLARLQSRASALESDIAEFCIDHNLNVIDFQNVLLKIIMDENNELEKFKNAYDLCTVRDLTSPFLENIKYDYVTHPIALLISPYASKRDILDFINKNYSTVIEPLQTKLRKPDEKLGKSRWRNPVITSRNSYIHEHSNLTIKEETEKIKDDLKLDMDEGYVSKIRNRERKRRQ